MWAARRLQRLEQEIEDEAKTNCEGIAFQLVLSEREWIENEFGVTVRGAELASPSTNYLPRLQPTGGLNIINPLSRGDASLSPSSPLSPGGSRLSEKLKGLKLQTNPESSVQPAEDEVAVPPCKGKIQKLVAEKGTSTAAVTPPSPSKPNKVTEATSIGTMLAGDTSSQSSEIGSMAGSGVDEEEELFALPLSPRSPEMAKSPFSWAAEDTRRYLSLAQSVS
jgi:hypothetical protein